jgi:hypothetical protein
MILFPGGVFQICTCDILVGWSRTDIDGQEGLKLISGIRVHGTTFKTRRENKVDFAWLIKDQLKPRRSIIFVYYLQNFTYFLNTFWSCFVLYTHPRHCNAHIHNFVGCLVYLGKHSSWWSQSVFFLIYIIKPQNKDHGILIECNMQVPMIMRRQPHTLTILLPWSTGGQRQPWIFRYSTHSFLDFLSFFLSFRNWPSPTFMYFNGKLHVRLLHESRVSMWIEPVTLMSRSWFIWTGSDSSCDNLLSYTQTSHIMNCNSILTHTINRVDGSCDRLQSYTVKLIE